MDKYLNELQRLDGSSLVNEAVYKPFPPEDQARTTDVDLDLKDIDLGDDEGAVDTFQPDSQETFLQKLDIKRLWLALQNCYYENSNHEVSPKDEGSSLNSIETPIPLLIYGDPGVGKSDIVKSFAQTVAKQEGREFVDWDKLPVSEKVALATSKNLDKYFLFIDFRVADKLPEDFGGIPQSSKDLFKDIAEETPFELRIYPLVWMVLRRRDPAKEGSNARGIIFLDEVNQGIRPTLFALYKLVLDNKVGELALSPFLFKVAAGNYEGTSSNGTTMMPEALAARFKTAFLVADWQGWKEWASEKDIHGNQRIDSDILDFISQEPDALFNVRPADTHGKEGAKYASPRNIARFSRSYSSLKRRFREAKARGTPIKDFTKQVGMEGIMTVGKDFTQNFVYFLRATKMYDVRSVGGLSRDEFQKKQLGEKMGLMRWLKNEIFFALNDNVPLKNRADSFKAIVNGFFILSNEKKTILLQDLNQITFKTQEEVNAKAKEKGQGNFAIAPTVAAKLIVQLSELVRAGTVSNPQKKETIKVELPHPEYAQQFLSFIENSKAVKQVS
jgi:energy-coupling factor transporter ATP-binding protein EcfA2